jgi:hypothetical protein
MKELLTLPFPLIFFEPAKTAHTLSVSVPATGMLTLFAADNKYYFEMTFYMLHY